MQRKRIGVLGSGVVGQTLANGLKDAGFEVKIGRRTAGKVDNWEGSVVTSAECTGWAEIVILVVKGMAAEEVVSNLKSELAGKTVIDTTNPIADEPPDDGVLRYFTDMHESLMERLQRKCPAARFVKAFNSVGNALMVKPQLANGPPTMFICGNDQASKKEVTDILEKFGWEAADMGSAKSARAIEPLCILWCLPGFLRNDWQHAFKLITQ